jgi:G6PDH family F420-dependent oxidoreductase
MAADTVELGYFLSSEEHDPRELVRQARLAADAGMESVCISDHFHPWLEEQGQSPFVWSVIGGIAATTRLRVTTAVTCPTTRIHPVVTAQAAATSALLLDGRFELGIGTGENLNEHVLGDHWPPTDVRLEMLEEAVEVIRLLWSGEEISHRGRHYTVENARIYSRPTEPPPILMSAFGAKAAAVAGRLADGFVSTHPDPAVLAAYENAGGQHPLIGAVKVCWGPDKDDCARLAHKLWRTGGVPGELSQELRTPALFTQATTNISVDSVAEATPCGPDPAPMIEAVKEFVDAGFDRVYINQIGPDQDGFFDFFTSELAPGLAGLAAAVGA